MGTHKTNTSCPLDTGSSGVGSTVENSSAVGSEPEDNEDFFFFEKAKMSSSTTENEVHKYLKQSDKSAALEQH